MAIYHFGHGVPPEDPYVYSVNLDGETVIARRSEGEFRTLKSIEDELAVRAAAHDQIVSEWAAAVDDAN